MFPTYQITALPELCQTKSPFYEEHAASIIITTINRMKGQKYPLLHLLVEGNIHSNIHAPSSRDICIVPVNH